MFVQAARYSMDGTQSEQKADEIYAKAVPMWEKVGAHSINHFVIADGDKKGQHMVVVRFDDASAWQTARDSITDPRAELAKEIEAAGIKLEEILLLDEVPEPVAQASNAA